MQSIRFFSEMRHHPGESLKAGNPISVKREFIEIITPGALDPILTRPVLPTDREQYPVEYARYQNGEKEEAEIVGWRLEDWPKLTRDQVDHLRSQRFFTVEQLAEASDAHLQRLMGGHQLRLSAQTALKARQDTALADRLATEKAQLESELRQMREQIKALQDASEKRGPGRPRKLEEAA